MKGQGKKVVVFGVDGGTYNVMRPLLEQGYLPNLASLALDGVKSGLVSTNPFITPTAFTSFMTGVNPGKHGLFDFTSNSHRTYDNGPIVNSNHIKVKTLWNLLTEYGKRMNVITVPFTYPPTPLNGTMLCLGNVSEGRFRSYPPALAQEILDHIGGYEQRYVKVIREPNGPPSEALLDEIVDMCNYQLEKSKQAAMYLLKTYPWDFLMMVFVITDRFQHYYWRYMDPGHPAYEPINGQKRGNLIADSYRKADEAIGEILKLVPKESHVMVMSDHGFGPLHYVFHTNRWLEEQGLLHLHTKRAKWMVSSPSIEKCVNKVGLSKLAKKLPGVIRNIRVPVIVRKPIPLVEVVDWSRTKAYATRWGININLKAREPFGIVVPGRDYENLVETIIKGLREINDPKTGMSLFDLVVRKEEIYYGPYVDEAHDILISSGNAGLRKDPGGHAILREITARDFGNGEHRREGILILKGPLIDSDGKPDNPQLEDLSPTILYLMGLPVPDYMDGKVLTSCIKRDVLERNPVVRVSSVSMNREETTSGDTETSKEDDMLIRQQLKSLGYIE